MRDRLVIAMRGGGVRGLMQARYLAALERAIGRRLWDAADLLVGTSTGGILAIGLGMGHTAADMVAFYRRELPAIFRRPLLHRIRTGNGTLGARYPADALLAALRGALGDRTLGDTLTRVMATVHEMEDGTWLDGGVHSVDPVDDAAAEAVRLWPEDRITILGVGNQPAGARSPARYLKSWHADDGGIAAARAAYATASAPTAFPPFDRDGRRTATTDWGISAWGIRISGLMIDGSGDSAHYRTMRVAEIVERIDYLRVDPVRDGGPMDDASAANLSRLLALGQEMEIVHAATTAQVAGRFRAPGS